MEDSLEGPGVRTLCSHSSSPDSTPGNQDPLGCAVGQKKKRKRESWGDGGGRPPGSQQLSRAALREEARSGCSDVKWGGLCPTPRPTPDTEGLPHFASPRDMKWASQGLNYAFPSSLFQLRKRTGRCGFSCLKVPQGKAEQLNCKVSVEPIRHLHTRDVVTGAAEMHPLPQLLRAKLH